MSLEEKSRFTDKETFLLVEGRFRAKLFPDENEKKSDKREDRYKANKMNERKNKYIKKIKKSKLKKKRTTQRCKS
jgi:CRISPR/Cas system-associated endonuclease Cas1